MTTAEIRAAVLKALRSVAPETEGLPVDDLLPLREQFDLDSMDFLNFLVAVHLTLGVEIAEKDYPKLATVNGCVKFVEAALQRAA
jgi:acyl carrier protein